jgi:precorrin-2 dehydrogenase/sirohydrochlorin ferrochelatase
VIPLLHDFEGETVLVFGGGPVGARKARRFAREARVVVVSPTFGGDAGGTDDGDADAGDDGTDDGDADAGDDGRRDFGGADLVRAAPGPDDVGGWLDRAAPALVVAATGDEAVNAAVASAAADRGILVNRADRAGERDAGSVVVPATVEDDPVTVAVATGGRAPALSTHLRERIEAEIEGAGAMADLVGDLRAELKTAGVAPAERRDAVRAVVRSSRVWKGLRAGTSKARAEADRVIRDRTEGYARDG